MISEHLQAVRFDTPDEAEFRAYFEVQSKKSRGELWIVLLIGMAFVIVFHRVFLNLPPEVVPLGKALIMGVMVPAVLRWMSARGSPFHHWSMQLYIIAAFVDIGCLLLLRVACLNAGVDVVPLLLPVAVLLSLIVAQIPFVILLPVVLVGLSSIVSVELLAFEITSNRLFQVAATIALVLVALSPAYGIERWMRLGWQRLRRLNELAYRDELTGLATRRSFEERFHETVAAATRSRRSVTLMMLDIDHFKAYNDHYGHPAGDECLRGVGNYLHTAMRRPQDFAARLGGEEFAVVWFDISRDDALRMAEEILLGIAELGIAAPPGGEEIVTASGGVAYVAFPRPSSVINQQTDKMLMLADQALYTAKRGGRNRVVISEKEIEESSAIYAAASPILRPSSLSESIRQGWAVDPPLSLKKALRFPEPSESQFRAEYENQGRFSRRLILLGLLAVIITILVIAVPVLKVPEDQYFIGAVTLVIGLMPATILALLGTMVRPLFPRSAILFIGAVGVILAAQMGERVVQLPKGYDMVPFIMPISVLLSLSVVQIRFGLMAPAILIGLFSVVGVELWAFDLTSHRLLNVATAILMVLVTLSFAYKLELSNRLSWIYQRDLDERAHTDALTHLHNRRSFDVALRKVIRAAAREQRSVALVILDIDYFKAYNDHFGHPAGDECLRRVGGYLNAAMRRPLDFAARVGGEEFIAVWFDAPFDDAFRLAEELRGGIAGLGIAAPQEIGGMVTASAGFVHVASPSRDIVAADIAAEMTRNADTALYQAKLGNRNRMNVYNA